MDVCMVCILSIAVLLCGQFPMATRAEVMDMTGDLKVPVLRYDHHRSKRKVLHFNNFPTMKWPLHIPYLFENTLFSLTSDEKSVVRDILTNVFEAHTCLTFEEIDAPPTDNSHYLYFRRHEYPWHCSSGVGVATTVTGQQRQDIKLGQLCFTIGGHVMFTIAGALGMHGEVRRPDRDDYIDLFLTKINPEDREFTETIPDDLSTSHGIHYDFGSVMHPGARAFLIPELEDDMYAFTLVPKDGRYLRSIGQASEFAFHDALVLNTAYCEDHQRSAAPPQLDCQNGGYQAPPDYTCRCPDGFEGDRCQSIHTGSAACNPASGYQQVTGQVQCVTSPNYDRMEYEFGDSCTWVLQAPSGKHIDAWFDRALYLTSLGGGYSPCLHWVEIKHEGRAATQGPRYCNNVAYGGGVPEYDPPTNRTPITSAGNEMMVIFKAPDFRTTSLNASQYIVLHTGFRLCYTISDQPSPAPLPTPSKSKGRKHDDEDDDLRLAVIGIIVAVLLLLLILVVIVLICCVYRRRKKRQTPPPTPQPAVAYVNPGYAEQSTVNILATVMASEIKKNPDELDFSHVGTPGGPAPTYPVAPPEYEEVPKTPEVPIYTNADASKGKEEGDADFYTTIQNTSNDYVDK